MRVGVSYERVTPVTQGSPPHRWLRCGRVEPKTNHHAAPSHALLPLPPSTPAPSTATTEATCSRGRGTGGLGCGQQNPRCLCRRSCRIPLPSESGIYKAVKARSLPWLSDQILEIYQVFSSLPGRGGCRGTSLIRNCPPPLGPP